MTTMPLASYLACSWRFEATRLVDGFAQIMGAARKLDALVWERHKIKLLMCSDAMRFRDMVVWETGRAEVTADTAPLLGAHTDATCRALDRDNFFALIGTKTDRPLPLFTTNTACRYDDADAETNWFGNLFLSRRLWSDHPERDCPDLSIDATGWTAGNFYGRRLPMVHVGTAWVRDDKRGKGIAGDVVRLHRMVAWLRWGLPIFGTVAEQSNHAKAFKADLGKCIGRVIEKRGDVEKSTLVHLYTPEDIERSAKRVLVG